MAYEKQTWETGDTITAQKLNHMEDGIAQGCVLVVTDTDGTLNKTWKEIHDALASGIIAIIPRTEDDGTHTFVGFPDVLYDSSLDEPYTVNMGSDQYRATTENDYPTLVISDGGGDW